MRATEEGRVRPSKTQRKRIERRIRRTWGTLKPVTRVKQSKRIYSRKRIPAY